MRSDIEVAQLGIADAFIPRSVAGLEAMEQVFGPAPEAYRQRVIAADFAPDSLTGVKVFFAETGERVAELRELGASVKILNAEETARLAEAAGS